MSAMRRFGWMPAAAVCLLALSACSSSGGGIANPFQNPSQQQAQSQPAPAAPVQPASVQPKAPPATAYYDFSDVPIPPDMTVQTGDSFIFQNGQIKAGVLVLKGRVEPRSLINFFQLAMVRDKWRPRAGFTSARSVLIYEKPEKMCVINVQEKMVYTYAEVYVAPSSQ